MTGASTPEQNYPIFTKFQPPPPPQLGRFERIHGKGWDGTGVGSGNIELLVSVTFVALGGLLVWVNNVY